MKTNKGQRAMLADRARHTRHEMYADDVLALCDDMDALIALFNNVEPLIENGPAKDKIKQAVRV